MNLKPDNIRARLAKGNSLSDPILDPHFADALKRAEALLRAASNLSDEEVEAYRIFHPRGLMTYKEIEKHFASFGWTKPVSRNTIGPCIEKLLKAAHEKIEQHLPHYEDMLGSATDGAVSFQQVEVQVGNALSNALDKLGIADLISADFDPIRRTARYFMHIVSQKVASPWGLTGESYEGYSTFIPYVCGGMDYDEFQNADVHRVRPYEIFLFAAQEGLEQQRLVERLSKLTEVPAPPRWPNGSILWSHDGSSFAQSEAERGNGFAED